METMLKIKIRIMQGYMRNIRWKLNLSSINNHMSDFSFKKRTTQSLSMYSLNDFKSDILKNFKLVNKLNFKHLFKLLELLKERV